jgi:hypothetical protein
MNLLKWLEEKRLTLEEDIAELKRPNGEVYASIIKEKASGIYYLWVDDEEVEENNQDLYLLAVLGDLKIWYSQEYREKEKTAEGFNMTIDAMYDFNPCSGRTVKELLYKFELFIFGFIYSY